MQHDNEAFEGLLSRYFENLLQDEPVTATIAAGISSGEGKLGASNLRFHQRREKERRAALAGLDKQSPRDLSREQQIDRLALTSKLMRECEDYSRGRHTLEPNAPEHLLGILFHELRRGQDEPARSSRNLRSLLADAPRFLRESREVLVKTERVWLRVMEETVRGAELLLSGVSEFLGRDKTNSSETAIDAVLKALHQYRDYARDLPSAPAGSFAIGPACLQRRVRDELGLDYTLGQIETLALRESERINTLLRKACARFGRDRSPESIIAEAREAWRPGRPLVELYELETRRIAQGFRAARAVTFPEGDQLQVRAVPEFMRALIPTAAYTQPGAFARKQMGVFWVNDLSVTKQTAS
jgi:uncharacterized protein (DUF885 family)